MKPSDQKNNPNRALRDAMVRDSGMKTVRAKSKIAYERILKHGRRVRRKISRYAKSEAGTPRKTTKGTKRKAKS